MAMTLHAVNPSAKRTIETLAPHKEQPRHIPIL